MFVLTDCPVPRCAKRHGVVSDKPRRGPAKPFTGPTVSPLALRAESPIARGSSPLPASAGASAGRAERPSPSGN